MEQQKVTQQTKKQKKVWPKILCIILVILLMIGISAVVAAIIHKRIATKPASATIANGLSAYELAALHGYDGTVQEWLESLSGKSAYQIAVDNGYTGTEKEWADSLEAVSKQTNISIKTASFSSKGELLITLSDNTVLNLGVAVGKDGANGTNGINGKDGQDGSNGVDGKNGADGKDGLNGADGVSVTKSEINTNGELVLTYSNGQSANLGLVVGADGKNGLNGSNGKDGADGLNGTDGKDGTNGIDGEDGISVVNSVINASGELVLTYSDGKTANLGVVIGAKGDKGDTGTNGANGADGADGISVTNAEINSNGELVLTYSNNQRFNLGNVIGADGKDGTNGTNGADGKDGTNGVDGISVMKSEINSKSELVLAYSDNAVDNLGVVIGAKGDKGDTGANGANGADGKDGANGADGRGILRTEISGNKWIIYYTDNTFEEHDLSGLVNGGESPEEEILIFVELPDGTYGVKAGIKAQDAAVIEIPETHNGKAVTEIIANGFERLTTLQSITFPIGLRKIGSYAFRGCSSLSTITIPENVTCIEEYAFYQAGLKNVYLTYTHSWTLTGVKIEMSSLWTNRTYKCTATNNGTSTFNNIDEYIPALTLLDSSHFAIFFSASNNGLIKTSSDGETKYMYYGYSAVWTRN